MNSKWERKDEKLEPPMEADENAIVIGFPMTEPRRLIAKRDVTDKSMIA